MKRIAPLETETAANVPGASMRSLFDIPAATAYVVGLGAVGVSVSTIRAAIGSGRLPYLKLGKKFFVSRAALDQWIARCERRGAPR